MRKPMFLLSVLLLSVSVVFSGTRGARAAFTSALVSAVPAMVDLQMMLSSSQQVTQLIRIFFLVFKPAQQQRGVEWGCCRGRLQLSVCCGAQQAFSTNELLCLCWLGLLRTSCVRCGC
jgi:hypothetical protein